MIHSIFKIAVCYATRRPVIRLSYLLFWYGFVLCNFLALHIDPIQFLFRIIWKFEKSCCGIFRHYMRFF